jgi:hypothetical protein
MITHGTLHGLTRFAAMALAVVVCAVSSGVSFAMAPEARASGCGCCCSSAPEAPCGSASLSQDQRCSCESAPATPAPAQVPAATYTDGAAQSFFAHLPALASTLLVAGREVSLAPASDRPHLAAATPVALHLRINC